MNAQPTWRREDNADVIRRELAAIYPDSVQLELDLEVLVTPAYEPAATIQERFEAFHAANPWVYRAFERLTADALAHGHARVGIGMFTEVIRWQYGRRTDGDPFKVNNSYRSRYARMLLDKHPEWAGVFETRELKSA